MTLYEGQYMLPDGSVIKVIATIGGNWRLQGLDGTPLYYIANSTIKRIHRSGKTVHLVDSNLHIKDLQPVASTNL